MDSEKLLEQLVDKLKAAAGPSLRTVALYGSAAGGEFHEKYSDLNVLCLIRELDGSKLEKLREAAAQWTKKGHPAPLVFAAEELQRLASVFPIELTDIQSRRRVLYGEDVFATFEVPMQWHRAAVERELETNLVRLRQNYLSTKLSAKPMMRLMTASVSSFVTLFRHALVAHGEVPPQNAREAIDRLAARLGFDAAPLHLMWDVRERKRSESSVDARATWRAYVESLQCAVQMVHPYLEEALNPGKQTEPQPPAWP